MIEGRLHTVQLRESGRWQWLVGGGGGKGVGQMKGMGNKGR